MVLGVWRGWMLKILGIFWLGLRDGVFGRKMNRSRSVYFYDAYDRLTWVGDNERIPDDESETDFHQVLTV